MDPQIQIFLCKMSLETDSCEETPVQNFLSLIKLSIATSALLTKCVFRGIIMDFFYFKTSQKSCNTIVFLKKTDNFFCGINFAM